jgi:anti-sigma regulatory factor (Ser/Thr protein kinase)
MTCRYCIFCIPNDNQKRDVRIAHVEYASMNRSHPMRKMPVLSTDTELNERIAKVCQRFDNFFVPVFIDNNEDALEYITYELPEVNVINYSDKNIDTTQVIETIKNDPWLHYGGIIAVHSSKDARDAAEAMPDSNIISLIPRGEFVTTFFRVLRILIQNRQILFQRDIQAYLLDTISGSFVMDNDPSNIRTYANLVTNFLYNLNYVDTDRKERLHVALFEMLMNAVEHGNCRISYEEKTDWLNEHGDILPLIRQKCRVPEIRNRKVFLSYRINPQRSVFTIRDEGDGFNWQDRLDESPQKPNFSMHGHGIKMVRHYVDDLSYNETGNEVAFTLNHQQVETNIVPGMFHDQEEEVFLDGQTVFTEGEESNYLYYIVSGRMKIYVAEKYITTVKPDDIFLGEMSFLLNNKRSATVVSSGRSVLLKITKVAFINVIKKKPHYGIFLARLLAQRISRLNIHVASMTG